jgi:hypothetical protein
MGRPPVGWALIFGVGLGAGLFGLRAVGGESTGLSFNREIRPILSQHCFACHGPDEKTRKAGLRLDLEEDAFRVLKSGHRALVPGKPSESTLVQRIETADPDEHMPPAETKKPLTPEKIALLKRWVEEGAKYEGHWAYVPPRRTDPPSVRRTDWVRNDLDRFVLSRLERENLEPGREASKERLLRRVTLDLTGLPPTVEELEAFVADGDSKAYEKVVDRLLGSPHYGERMAQQWLDLARYGETQGYHHDRHRDQWHWRDWVIGAFNANMPYDRFTVEQLAGDQLPEPSRDQLVATGFHRNEMTTSEGGALPEEYIVKYAVGRVDTTARVWMGTSMACAECHDHKYDPISTKDYYRFFAFFFDTPENGLDAEELNPSPRITLETPEQRTRLAELNREVSAMETAEKLLLESPRDEWDSGQSLWERRHRDESLGGWQVLGLNGARVVGGASIRQAEDGTLTYGAASADGGTTYELRLKAPAGASFNGIRLEALPDPGAPERGAGLGRGGEFLISKVEAEIRSADPSKEIFPGDAPDLGAWQVLGPFRAGNAKEAFDKDFGPEKTFDPAAVYQDGKVRWSAADVKEDSASAGERTVQGGPGATYLTRIVRVETGRIVEAEVASEGPVKLWLNGRQVYSNSSARAWTSEPERARLWLRPGENRLLVKVAQGAEPARVRVALRPGAVTSAEVEFASAAADFNVGKNGARGLLDADPATGWSVGTNASVPHVVWLRAAENFGFQGGTEWVVRLRFESGRPEALLGRFRLSAISSPTLAEFLDYPEDVRGVLAVEESRRTAEQRLVVRRYFRQRAVPEVGQTQQMLAARRRERDGFRNSWPTAMVMREASPKRDTQIRVRGQYAVKGETVEPGVPERMFGWKPEWPANRLGLAKWLTDPGHPLTSRVAVNQYWQRYFGTGLVKTAEEFGSQGEWPSHPDLLDWLATEFVRTGWDVKAMQRLIVTSATYRQDSAVSKEWLERDPENRLLARGPRFRLDAENIRDVALSASGLLNAKVGGPSAFPYQPPGLWGQVSFEGTRDYMQSEGPENYRRGLYTYWRRSIPYAGFTVFDAPSREVCVVRRPRTNTPLQALALMNDPVYVEASRALAQRILARGGKGSEDRIDYAFRVTLGRRPSETEKSVLKAACEREMKRFAADRESANRLIHVGVSKPPVDVDIAELAAWTVVASTLLNLDEAVSKG